MKFKGVFPVLLIAVSCISGRVQAESTLSAATPEQIEVASEAAASDSRQQQTSAAEPESDSGAPQEEREWFNMGNIGSFFPLILIAFMIFLMFRANKKQQRQRMEMLNKIVKGSKVMLNSGVIGKVYEVREKEFLVEIAENVRVLVIREGVNLIEDEPKKEDKK